MHIHWVQTITQRGRNLLAVYAAAIAWASLLLWGPAIAGAVVTLAAAVGWSVWIERHPTA